MGLDQRLEGEGWQLLERYADVELSLTDATSVVAARRSKIREVFGLRLRLSGTWLRRSPDVSSTGHTCNRDEILGDETRTGDLPRRFQTAIEGCIGRLGELRTLRRGGR